jgi:hypothetical protein
MFDHKCFMGWMDHPLPTCAAWKKTNLPWLTNFFGVKVKMFLFVFYLKLLLTVRPIKTVITHVRINLNSLMLSSMLSKKIIPKQATYVAYTRAVCKFCGFTLLRPIGTLWRCSDGLFFEVPSFSRTCCRPLITSKFLASELPFHGWKSPEIAWDEIWIEYCVRLGKSGSVDPHYNIRHTVQISPGPCDFWAFPTMKRELRGKKFRSD